MSRKPILLSKNACALIWIFNRNDEIFDVVAGAYEKFDSSECWNEAAKEFIDQLKEHYSISFMEALKLEIEKIIEEHYCG